MALVGAVLVDYDGTSLRLVSCAPESRTFRGVEAELRTIVKNVAVCIVTAEDFQFHSSQEQEKQRFETAVEARIG